MPKKKPSFKELSPEDQKQLWLHGEKKCQQCGKSYINDSLEVCNCRDW